MAHSPLLPRRSRLLHGALPVAGALLSLLAAGHAVRAGNCDARALVAELEEASPARVAGIVIELCGCDRDMAEEHVPGAIARLLPESGGREAAVAAMGLGRETRQAVIAWFDAMQSDERAAAFAELGELCQGSEMVQLFFIEAEEQKGMTFWNDRWYRALETCRVPGIQEKLYAEVKVGFEGKRSSWAYGALETYARNMGPGFIPQLKILAEKVEDEEGLMHILDAFSDAAGVGSVQGMDEKGAEMAVQAIVDIAAGLPVRVLEQARIAVQSMGDERAADGLAVHRYKAGMQKDGRILWGTVVAETATCKNGKVQQRVHVANVTDPGQTWADQLQAKVEAAVKGGWTMDLAEKCKGEGTISVHVPGEAFADQAAFKAWTDDQVRKVERASENVARRVRVDHEPVQL